MWNVCEGLLDVHQILGKQSNVNLLCENELVLCVFRCHQNDLENIIPFVVIGLLYALTGPELSTALLHFRLFVGSRFVHTIAYVMQLPQPSRGLSWMVGMGTTFSMAYHALTTVLRL